MRTTIAAFVSGLVFGIGLAVSQMINPAKVLAFLDFGGIPAGAWDPSLALVMAGALLLAGIGFRLARGRERALDGGKFAEPPRREIDARLVAGALLFGAGWGLVGFCPGPALASLALGAGKSFLFVFAMLAGMAIHRYAIRAPQAATSAAD
jgi:uncharacterized protein